MPSNPTSASDDDAIQEIPVFPATSPPARHRWFRAVAAALALVAVLSFGACGLLVWDGLTDRPGVADFAVVPGNKVELNGAPSARLKARLDRAFEVYTVGSCRKIIVSGGLGKEGFDEGIVMRDYLMGRGVPAGDILVDSEGVDTWATARNVASLIAGTSATKCMVVSQYFHIPRTRLALQRFGLSADSSAHARIFQLRDLYSIPREAMGFVYYLFRPIK